jgi:uncharacterized alkaline shock family protein YloU
MNSSSTRDAERHGSQSSGSQGSGSSSSSSGSSSGSGSGSMERGQTKTAQPPARSEQRSMSGVSVSSELGSTRIGDGVVTKIANLAARDIPGVFSMGSGISRRVGQLRSMIPGGSEAASQGVSVEVGEKEAAVDLNIVTWYGQSIVEISEAVRRNVIGQIEGMTGLRVVEVNVQVDDIHVESDEDSTGEPQRVQ